MSKDQYLDMCEQMGEEPDWDKCPPEWDDFPQVVVDAVNIYYSLGSKVYPDIGFVGKDFTNFDFLLDLYKVPKHNIDFVFDLLKYLEGREVEASQRRLKAEYDKIKKK